MNFKRVAFSFLLFLTLLFIVGGVYVAQSNTQQDQPDIYWSNLNKKIEFQIQHFPGTAGIVIKDLKRGWIIQHNADKLFPSASLVKIPLMAALYDAHVHGRISLDEALSIQRKLKTGGSGTLKYARSGTRLTIRQLIFKMITESDNTAANMLSDLFGLDYYNSCFIKFGLRHTNFSRMIMDLRKRDQGIENYTTPQDMALLLEMIYENKLTGSDEMLEILKSQKINDRLPVSIPKSWQIGHKTGLMRNSCHDVGIIFSPTNDYLICALTSDIHNYRRAKSFISEISHLTALYYSDPALHPPVEKSSFWTRIWNWNKSKGRSS